MKAHHAFDRNLRFDAGGIQTDNKDRGTGRQLPYYPGSSVFAKAVAGTRLGAHWKCSGFLGLRAAFDRRAWNWKPANGAPPDDAGGLATELEDYQKLDVGVSLEYRESYQLYLNAYNLLRQDIENLDDALTVIDGEPLLRGGFRCRWLAAPVTGYGAAKMGAAVDPSRVPAYEDLLLALAESARVLVWLTGPGPSLEYLSPNWTDYSGLNPAGWRWEELLACVHPEDRDRLEQCWARILADGQPQGLEARLRRADGEYRWFRVQGRPIPDPSGRPCRWLGCASDVHENRTSARADRDAVRELQERLRAQGEDLETVRQRLLRSESFAALGLLAGSIAHEINNPNNFVKLNLPALRDYLKTILPVVDAHAASREGLYAFGMSYQEFRQDLFRLVDNMEHGCDRITATVQYLREFIHRLQHGCRTSADLREIVGRALNVSRPEIMKRVRSLEVEDPGSPVSVRTNPEALEIVLINLLLCAARAADKEDSRVRVRVIQSLPEAAGGLVEVVDNGRGLTPEELRDLFDPASSLPDPDTAGGASLYACQVLMREVDGRLEVKSVPGRGSVLRVLLNQAAT